MLRKISTAEAQKVADKEGLKYFEISAKTGDNISKMIYSAIADLSFFEQFDVIDKNSIINELGKLKFNFIFILIVWELKNLLFFNKTISY